MSKAKKNASARASAESAPASRTYVANFDHIFGWSEKSITAWTVEEAMQIALATPLGELEYGGAYESSSFGVENITVEPEHAGEPTLSWTSPGQAQRDNASEAFALLKRAKWALKALGRRPDAKRDALLVEIERLLAAIDESRRDEGRVI